VLDRNHAVQVRCVSLPCCIPPEPVRRPYGFNVPYRTLFHRFEQILTRYGGRPHWAKAHHLRPDDLRKLYPRFDDFRAVLERVDPHGMLRNEYVERHIFGAVEPRCDERVFEARS
jgi:L-gulonolactone oxidase